MSDDIEDKPCPACGVTMPVQVDRQLRYSRLESHSRWECNNDRCAEWGTTFFDDNGTLVVALRSIRPGDPRYCDICQEPLAGGQEYAPYEDETNEDRYIVCPRGHKNYRG
jgi:hypothetical protein